MTCANSCVDPTTFRLDGLATIFFFHFFPNYAAVAMWLSFFRQIRVFRLVTALKGIDAECVCT